MSIRNEKLGGTDLGGERLTYPDVNDTNDAIIDLAVQLSLIGGKNLIRTLINRSAVYSNDQSDWWGDAYIDSDGGEDSVDTGNTTSKFLEYNKAYYSIETETNERSTGSVIESGANNPSYAFDGNSATAAGLDTLGEYLGLNFGSTLDIGFIYLKINTQNWKLQYYDGSWNDSDISSSNYTDESNHFLGKSCSQIRIYKTSSGSLDIYQVEPYSITSGDTIITHIIPTGTFSSTISHTIGTAIVEDWESGADIQFKLTNTGGDDTGWLDYNEINNFTAFTSEPDTLIVKLIPKDTSPTAGTPSLRGFAVRAW